MPSGRWGLCQVCTPSDPTSLGPSGHPSTTILLLSYLSDQSWDVLGRGAGAGTLNTPSLCLLSQFLGKMAPNFTILIKNSIHYPKFQFSK